MSHVTVSKGFSFGSFPLQGTTDEMQYLINRHGDLLPDVLMERAQKGYCGELCTWIRASILTSLLYDSVAYSLLQSKDKRHLERVLIDCLNGDQSMQQLIGNVTCSLGQIRPRLGESFGEWLDGLVVKNPLIELILIDRPS